MLTFEEYRDAGGTGTLEEFGQRMAVVWPIVDDAVMGRWDQIDDARLPAARLIVTQMLDHADEIEEEQAGGQLTSFSNGVTSYGFGSAQDGQASGIVRRYVDRLVEVLPVSIVSRAIGREECR